MDDGIALYRRLARENPGTPEFLYGLGSCFFFKRRLALAGDLLRQAVHLRPDSWQLRLRQASLVALSGKPGRARAMVLELLSDGSSSPGPLRLSAIYGDAALYSFQGGQHREALGYIDRAVEFARRTESEVTRRAMSQLFGLRGQIYLALSSPGRALDDLAKSLQLARECHARLVEIHVLYAMSEANRAAGRLARSRALGQQVGELIDTYTDERRLRSVLGRGAGDLPSTGVASGSPLP